MFESPPSTTPASEPDSQTGTGDGVGTGPGDDGYVTYYPEEGPTVEGPSEGEVIVGSTGGGNNDDLDAIMQTTE